MCFRSAITLGLATLWAATGAPAEEGDLARFDSSYTWERDEPWFGGFSGMEIAGDGRRFLMVSDRGQFVEGVLERNGDGHIAGISFLGSTVIRNRNGDIPRPYERNSEGLAWAENGQEIFVSFEGQHKVEAFDQVGAPARSLPELPAEASFDRNESLEALAVDPQGRLVLVSEAQEETGAGFPIWRLEQESWRKIGSIPSHRFFRPVGADFGPDGRLYLLERSFDLIGFSNRVRRFEVQDDWVSGETVLFHSKTGVHDNLEAVAVWRDERDLIRLTMVSDDNFLVLQRTEVVEYVVEENP